ncbi:MoaD/ThiS family protein [Polaribacter sp. Z022]|uniref:MoaD/ThiS family protein n=1 Tax=Polaribacter sp. Z022 TaxID=2927125 RepID=UPI002021052D|nr:MoaD/ThiS family protein [Polaribacter sp. Z022]MCL7752294.1 MoaD/ThiS family protein [Polaribacter sp. Z022]
MKIKVLFFGITTDLVATSNLELGVLEGLSVSSFKNLLKENYPKLENIDSYAIAVNEEYASNELLLKENDVIAVIPPVSGG